MTKYEVLKTYFGYESFRPGQEELIDGLMEGRDVLGIMPTGAGKSICYQIPALLLPGITLVISPLISLMNDQVRALNEAGIHAAYINSSLSERQISFALDLARKGKYKIIYVAPERLLTPLFQMFVRDVTISLAAVDEAHCVSQWGQDFRKSYLQISDFVDGLKERPPVGAFTATATILVQKDILQYLKLNHPLELVAGYDRPNLYFAVRQVRNRLQEVVKYTENHKEDTGIIYCSTRKNVDKLYEALLEAGIRAGRYHAGLSGQERTKTQDDFVYDRIHVIVATNAFGMGIDKSNVRYVLHYNMPQSMENYYQEAGRAGRDGEPSECILFYSPQDIVINRLLLSHKGEPEDGGGDYGYSDYDMSQEEQKEEIDSHDEYRLQQMIRYANASHCLRGQLLKYFGQEPETENCGFCMNCVEEFEEKDITEEAKQLINCVYETRQRYGVMAVIGILLGSTAKKMEQIHASSYKCYGRLSGSTEALLRQTADKMVYEGYLKTTMDRYQILKLGDRFRELSQTSLMLRIPKKPGKAEKKENTAEAGATKAGFSSGGKSSSGKSSSKKKTAGLYELNTSGKEMFEHLRSLRRELAEEAHMPPYIIFSDATLVQMCVLQPSDEEEMLSVSGVGKHKYEQYGERFLTAIREMNHGEKTDNGTVVPDEELIPEKEKEDFYLTEEKAGQFAPEKDCSLGDLVNRLNLLRDAIHVKKLLQKDIRAYLEEKGEIREIRKPGIWDTVITEKGKQNGISGVDYTRRDGTPYLGLIFSEEAQMRIAEHYRRDK